MKKKSSFKIKLILICVTIVIIPVLVICMFSLNQFNIFTKDIINQSYEAMQTMSIENMQSGVTADYEKIQNIMDRVENSVKRLGKSSNMQVYLTAEKSALNQTRQNLKDSVLALYKTLNIHKDLLQDNLNSSLATSEYVMLSYGEPGLNSYSTVEWEAANQYTKKVTKHNLSQFLLGNTIIKKNFTFNEKSIVVDKTQELTNVTCTIFQRMNKQGDMLRICTNVKKLDGTRAVGTFIPAVNPDGMPNPVISTVMKGETFRGRAYVVNAWYITAYQPIRDQNNNIIGVLYVGVKQENEALNYAIRSKNIGKYNFAFVTNANGDIRIHPQKNLIGKNIINDLNITSFSNIIKNNHNNEKVDYFVYSSQENEIIAAALYFEEWDWYICLTTRADELSIKAKKNAETALKNEIIDMYNNTNVDIDDVSFKLINQIRFIDIDGHEKIALNRGKFNIHLKNIADADWFIDFLERINSNAEYSNIYHTKIDFSKNTKDPEMRIATPVKFNEKNIGLVVINLNWNVVWHVLKNHIYGKTGYAFIFNQEGKIITNDKYAFKNNQLITNTNYGDFWDKVKQGLIENKSMVGKYRHEEKEHLFCYKPMIMSHETYAIAATSPLKEFLTLAYNIKGKSEKNYNKTIIIILCVIILSLFLTIIISFFISNSISKSIVNIAQFVKKISEGDLSESLKINRNDEIGDMALLLNEMVTKQRKLIKLSYLRNLPTPIIEIDKEYNLTYLNDAAVLAIGIPAEQCIGQKCYDLIHTDNCKTEQCGCYRAMSGKTNFRSEVYLSFGNKERIPIIYTSVPILDKDKVVGAIDFLVEQKDIYLIINEVRQVTNDLSKASEALAKISESMNISINEMSDLSDQTSKYSKLIAESGESISSNVNSEAIAIEQMTASLGDVAKYTVNAKNISQQANEKSNEINEHLNSLVTASEEIEQIIAVISDIADSTDLLALNASIEAESAGAAGKGFAVVADEVQKLARESSDATTEITEKINNIQKRVQDTIEAIKTVSQIINEINTINNDISASIAEQNSAAIEISKTVNNTAKKALSVAANANDTNKMMENMTSLSKQSALRAEKTQEASKQLSKIATSLMEIVSKFKL